MKKYFYSVLAAGMLLVTSCTQDEWVDITKGEGQQKTFKVELPGAQSRAIDAYGNEAGSGKYADKLIFAMYEHGKNEVLITKFVEDSEKDGVFEVTLPMAKKVNYDILFMAYDPDNCAFVINNTDAEANNLRAVQLRSDLQANQEQYDAFVGRLTNQNINSTDNTVPLYRPFAQVNVATTLDDLNAIKALKSEVTHSDFSITNAPDVLDILDGSVNESTTKREYAAAPILTNHEASAYPYNEKISVDGTDYYYLGMSYVLAGNSSSTHDVKLNFYRSDDETITADEIISDLDIPGMPVEANFRTNIVGTLLTQENNYQISLYPIFDQPDNEVLANKAEVSTFDELQVAVDAASVNVPTIITLTDDITIGSRSLGSRASESDNITISAGKNIVLELNGKTIKQVKECTASYEMICNKGTLTIKDSSENGNGKISFKDTSAGDPNYGWGSYTVRNEGTLVVEGGKIEHLGEQDAHMICAIFQYSGSSTIHGGTITTPNYRSARLWGGEMTINGGTFDGQLWLQAVNNTADLTIKGGTFAPRGNDGSSVFVTNSQYDVKFAVTGGTFTTKIGCSDASKLAGCITGGTFTTEAKEKTNEALLSDGYIFQDNGNETYTVVQDGAMTLGNFVEAVIAANGTFDGEGIVVKIKPTSGNADNSNGCKVPNRLQEYGNPDVYYAQYQRFAELTDVNISNVTFNFVPAAVTVTDAWNTNGYTATAENINGELQFMNNGKVTLTNCTFNMVSVSPINATELKIAGCTFTDLKAYAIKDIKSGIVAINNNTFTNCNGGFWLANAPQSITANDNAFTQVGRRGAIQFSSTGDYTNSSIEIKGNNVEGAILWQLNETITDEQLEAIEKNNSYETFYVSGSIQPVAMIGAVQYKSLQEAFNVGGEITLLRDVTIAETVVLAEGKTAVLDLNGKTITANTEDGNAINNDKGGTLTIKDTKETGNIYGVVYTEKGSTTINGGTFNPVEGGSYVFLNYKGTLTINKATINGGSSYPIYSYDAGNKLIINDDVTVNATFGCINAYGTGGSVEINGGTYKMTGVQGKTSHIAYFSNVDATINGGTFKKIGDINMSATGGGGICAIYGAKLTIKGGEFAGDYADYYDWGGTNANNRTVAISIEGGTFKFKPTAAEGYDATQNEDGSWTVSAKQ